MDTVSFIPQNQKNINEQKSSKFLSKPYRSTLFWMTMCLFVYGSVVIGLYWIFVMRPKSLLNEQILVLNGQNGQYYPSGDLEQNIFNVSDIIQNRNDISSIIQSIEATYVPNLRVQNIAYTKTNNTITLVATVPTIEDVNTQVQAINRLSGVLPVDLPPLTQGGQVLSFSLIIRLK